MKAQFNAQMTCGINQHNRDISAHQGRYIDLKQFPDRGCELPEAKVWPALGDFVRDVNRSTAFRTTGCTASGKTPGGHSFPFVDIAFNDPRLRLSENSHRHLQQQVLTLHGNPAAPNLVLEMCDSDARMPDGEELVTTRLWFLGQRSQAEEAFPIILNLLLQQHSSDYVPLTDGEAVYRRDSACQMNDSAKPHWLRSLWKALTGN